MSQGFVCAHCGESFADEQHAEAYEHAKTCDKNPVARELVRAKELLETERTDNEGMHGLLREIEWVSNDGILYCPSCEADKREGHSTDCRLAKYIGARTA